MKQSKLIKWAKVLMIIVSIQLLNYNIILPSMVSFASSASLSVPKNEEIQAHTLEDLLHLGSDSNNSQADAPSEPEELTGEKSFELFAVSYLKKEFLKASSLSIQFVLYNNTAASLHKPELNTPPPKMA